MAEMRNIMQKFDATNLIADLSRLPIIYRVAFAAACAERQMLAYKLFHLQTEQGDSCALRHALNNVWENPEPLQEVENEPGHQIEEILALIPQEDGFRGAWTQEATNAQNAGMSVVYALRTRLTGDAQEAAWSAQVAYEAIDNFVINHERINISQPGGEHVVLSHPLVQAELARQRRDLDELLTANEAPAKLLDRLRDRASSEATIFFGPVS